jgi:hypothetical protein
MGGLMGNSLSIGLADGLPPSPPSIDLQHSLQRKGREYHVSVSKSVDYCVFYFSIAPTVFLSFHGLAPFDEMSMWPSVAAELDHRYGLSAQASMIERRSGRSAGSNTSLAVKPTVVLAQGGSWEIAYCNFIFGQLSSVVWGRFKELEGKVNCHLVGSARLPLVLIRGPIFCSRPIEIMQQPSCFIVVFLFYSFQSLVVRG